jgi:aspartate carbamoyltransferase regulatory subunit
MALKGNLRDISITQLLNLVNVARKTGTLIVERSQEQVYISFREGKLSYASNGTKATGLTMVLYHAQKLNAAQVRAINVRSSGMSDKELGLLLINSNYISQQEILASLQSYYLNMVNRLFTWGEGLFRFDTELLPPKDKITVRISLENLIIEGTRKMREWEQLQGEIPSLEMGLKFSQRPGVNLRNLNLNVDEWKVISFINPKNTIRQIAKATNKNDLEIRRIVYSFIQAGLVDMIRPEGVPVVKPIQPVQPVQPVQSRISTPQGSKTEQKSLIYRIINRIRSI